MQQFLGQLRTALNDQRIEPVLVERDGDSAVVHLKFANSTAKQQLRLLVGNGDRSLKALRIQGAQEGDVLTLWPAPQGASNDTLGGMPMWVLYIIGGVAGLLLVALVATCVTCCCWRAKRKRAKRLPMETGAVCVPRLGALFIGQTPVSATVTDMLAAFARCVSFFAVYPPVSLRSSSYSPPCAFTRFRRASSTRCRWTCSATRRRAKTRSRPRPIRCSRS